MPVPTSRLAAFYFAYFLALGAFSPYFSPHLESRGLDAQQISLLMGLWYGSRVFAPPLWHAWLRRRGHGGRWLVAGCALTLAGFSLFLLPLPSVGLALVMLVFASFYNAVMPQFEAVTLEQLGAQRHRYSRVRLWGSIGFLLANLGYGWLLQAVGYASLVLWMLPAYGLLLACAVANRSAAAAVALRAPDAARTESAAGPAPVLMLLWIAGLMQACHAPLYVYLSLFLAEHGWTPAMIGLAWALGVVAEVGMFAIMPQLLSRHDPRWLMAACLAAGGVRWWLTAAHPGDVGVVLALQLLHALTFAAFHASVMAMLSAGRSGAGLARAQAWLYGFASGGGGVVGALLAGWCWQQLGHAATFEAASLLSVLTLLLLPALPRHHAHAHPV